MAGHEIVLDDNHCSSVVNSADVRSDTDIYCAVRAAGTTGPFDTKREITGS
jgi:hypothetical protein